MTMDEHKGYSLVDYKELISDNHPLSESSWAALGMLARTAFKQRKLYVLLSRLSANETKIQE